MKCSKCGKQISDYVNKCKFCKQDIEPNYDLLVKKAINNDKKAKEALYSFNYKSTYFVALKMIKNENDAMDMVQDSFLKAFSSLETLNEPQKFPSWLNKITANLCRDYFKKKRPSFFEDINNGRRVNIKNNHSDFIEDINKVQDEKFDLQIEDTSAIIPSDWIENKDVQRTVKEIINNLPEEQKLCVLMFYYDNLGVREIAETLEVSEGTIKSRLNYARKKMKDEVITLSKHGTELRGISVGWLFKWGLELENAALTLPAGITALTTTAVTTTVASTILHKIIVIGSSAIIAIGTAFGVSQIKKTNMPQNNIIASNSQDDSSRDPAKTTTKVTKKTDKKTSKVTMSSDSDADSKKEIVETNETSSADNSEEDNKKIFHENGFGYSVFTDNTVEIVSCDNEGKTITIPKKLGGMDVVSISDNCFRNCSAEKINMPDSIVNLGSAFISSDIKEIKLSKNLRQIKMGSFQSCTNLRKISIPDNVSYIGDSAFDGCKKLKSVDFSNNLKVIGKNAFGNCGLEDVILPEGLITIEDYAFDNCQKLKSVLIPKTVKKISYNAIIFLVNESDNGFVESCDNIKIYCYKNTFGEKYAKENFFKYELIDEKVGNNNE